ncbi:MAG: hypothetical protein ACREMN_04130, partial [Gemmatimonadales bacterium]
MMLRTTIVIAALLAAGAGTAGAQDPRLARLDSDSRPVVAAIIDSARAAGLPVEPLVQRALEGVAKRAAGARIIAAVRRLAADLASAQA